MLFLERSAFISLIALIVFVVDSEGWKAVHMSARIGKILEPDDPMTSLILRRKSVIHTRYKYNRCYGKQNEIYNKTVYQGIQGRQLLYFEVPIHVAPRCVIFSMYVPPRDFLKPSRYLVNLCLGVLTFIRQKSIMIRYLLEFSFKTPIPHHLFVIIAVRMGSAS